MAHDQHEPDYKFRGWMGLDESSVDGKMVFQEYEPKPFEESDVDIKITHCGVCGSDIHTLRSGWGPTLYPCLTGHEIIGIVVRAGSKVEGGLMPGDRVGVGAQSMSCLRPDCEQCFNNMECYCQNAMIPTYNSIYPGGAKSYGGFADYWRGPSHFVVKIPDAIASDVAAPMLCAGIATFSPLKKNGAGPGKTVGIIGLGGLGHFGIMGAKALECDKVVAISRSSAKKEDALKLGATDFVATAEDADWAKTYSNTLDLILCTVSSADLPLTQYLQLLRVNGQFIQLGSPDESLPSFNAFALTAKGAKMGGSSIGSPSEIREMLDFFARKGVRTWNINLPMHQANKAILDLEAGKARYRYVLVNEDHV
ncbi:hypothetical protein LTR99_004991 [Exophiala xenobiotica]|uniref:alcohol dehydrogenase (NADP(+)) n=1 Tax=Vermiconidia calcicola TaxID=1690605 RepID=A0AAV9PTQ2_9PEZI|nr:putative secondary metabolism biosynthetic enzyme [Exophiala xenobiotica]KAK5528257.1 hypothetical protein LTR25_010564 [Vermiconidia calcicola]KAK5534147.1 hypothetical protein LTR23_008940 [Chaetothyriales sp. CCFEE 6169]KAK5226862.1 hypothetical protein LTR72_002851 [Exophiala xenobiotica]KAK5234362.1 hypothetical protein LTR47_004395 [Exophiala xenobiotica]